MPRRFEMSWEGDPRFRWVKMYRGVRYRVTCQELKAPVWTKEASAGLANAWWAAKRAEVDGPSPVARVAAAVEQIPLDRLRDLVDRGNALQRLLAELPFVRADLARDEVSRIVGEAVASDQEAAEKLQALVGKVTGEEARPAAPAFDHHAERFLRVAAGKPKTWEEIRDVVRSLYSAPGFSRQMPVADIDADKVEGVYLWLRDSGLSAVSKRKRWRIFKRLIRYLWEAGLMELPRNLNSPSFRFRVVTAAVKTWPVDEVRRCLACLRPQLRLYALLGLNCGMTNIDIGQLRKSQVDLTRGRLVRKRVKTESHADVPTVDYPLWAETLELVRQFWSTHPELAFTTRRGTELVGSRREGQAVKVKDAIRLMWMRNEPRSTIPLKAFRSISATLLETHPAYGRYKGHFLGHSPKSIADKHYAAPSADLFDQAVGWLHDQIVPGGDRG